MLTAAQLAAAATFADAQGREYVAYLEGEPFNDLATATNAAWQQLLVACGGNADLAASAFSVAKDSGY